MRERERERERGTRLSGVFGCIHSAATSNMQIYT